LSCRPQPPKASKKARFWRWSGRQLDSSERAEPEIKVGDAVLFARYAGTEINWTAKIFS
jgi:co-chaperonin GroES (HSP10)